MEFNVCSNNTLSYINLHDCVCEKLYYTQNDLILSMEWIEILADHPDNPYDKAHQSDSGKIIFISPTIIEGKIIPWKSDEKEKRITTIEDLLYKNLTILDFSEEKKDIGIQAYLYAELDTSESGFAIELEIRYMHSKVMWNNLNDESWFEDIKWKKN